MVAEVGMSSIADEEEESVWNVSTDIAVGDRHGREGRTEGRVRLTNQSDLGSDQTCSAQDTLFTPSIRTCRINKYIPAQRWDRTSIVRAHHSYDTTREMR